MLRPWEYKKLSSSRQKVQCGWEGVLSGSIMWDKAEETNRSQITQGFEVHGKELVLASKNYS